MVFAESDPPVDVLTKFTHLGRTKQIKLFRDVLTLMGRSPIHEHLFFKFQSISTLSMEIALEVLLLTYAVAGLICICNGFVIFHRHSQRLLGHLCIDSLYRR